MDKELDYNILGFTPIGQLDAPDGIKRGYSRPSVREDCEALMMIGEFGREFTKTLFFN